MSLIDFVNEAQNTDHLQSSDFGLPATRKFPLSSATQVKMATVHFSKAKDANKAELARNIVKKAKEYGVTIHNEEILKWAGVSGKEEGKEQPSKGSTGGGNSYKISKPITGGGYEININNKKIKLPPYISDIFPDHKMGVVEKSKGVIDVPKTINLIKNEIKNGIGSNDSKKELQTYMEQLEGINKEQHPNLTRLDNLRKTLPQSEHHKLDIIKDLHDVSPDVASKHLDKIESKKRRS